MEFSLGAKHSPEDYRTIIADKAGTLPQEKGKVLLNYDFTNDLCNQRQLGICTACGVRMACEQHFNDTIRLSEYWLYLIGKVLIDGELLEGSHAFGMLKAANKYGVPTKDMEVKYPLKQDGSYKAFIDDFNSVYGGKIPQEVLDNASKHKIPGYYQVTVNPVSIAREIESGKVLVMRLTVGENTYTAPDGRISWLKEDLLPLRRPTKIEGGHIMVINEYEGLAGNQLIKGPNSWSKAWADNGYYSLVFQTQKGMLTETWAIGAVTVKDKLPLFTKDLWIGVTDKEVLNLQKFLNSHDCPVSYTGPGSKGNETTYFGRLTQQALKLYQSKNGIYPNVGYFGNITRTKINSILLK